jgi:hypothetical protein
MERFLLPLVRGNQRLTRPRSPSLQCRFQAAYKELAKNIQPMLDLSVNRHRYLAVPVHLDSTG